MKIIVIGDESKARDNFTKVMFDIVMERIKNGTIDEFYKKVENSKNKEDKTE